MSDATRTNRTLVLLAALASIAALAQLRAVLEPLMIAVFLSFVAMPVLRLGRRLGVPGPLTVAAIVGALMVGLGWVISLVYQSAADFLQDVPAYERQLRPHVVTVLERLDISTRILPPPGQGVPWRKIFTSTPLAGYAGSSLGGFLGWAGELLVVLTFLIFILLDRADGALDRRVLNAFAAGDQGQDVGPILAEINIEIERYIVVKAGISALTGALMAMVLSIFQVPFAVLFGAVAFVLNFIPNVGSIMATVPPLLVAFAAKGDLVTILPLAVILVGVQVTVGNILDPWLLGRSLRLSPTTVLFSLILWNWLWGIPGMVLAVPMAVVVRIILVRIPELRYVALIMSDAAAEPPPVYGPPREGEAHPGPPVEPCPGAIAVETRPPPPPDSGPASDPGSIPVPVPEIGPGSDAAGGGDAARPDPAPGRRSPPRGPGDPG